MAALDVEYCFLRYAPNMVRDENIVIATIVLDTCSIEEGTCRMMFAPDWQTKVRSVDSDADLEMLAALMKEIQDRLLSPSQRSDMMHMLEDSFSNLLQVSHRRKYHVVPDMEPATGPAYSEPLHSSSFRVGEEHSHRTPYKKAPPLMR